MLISKVTAGNGCSSVSGATTAKVEANNTAIKHLKRTGRGFVNSRNYSTRIMGPSYLGMVGLFRPVGAVAAGGE
ncbi:transposase [Arthrobacter sp. 2MCAF15]